MSMPQPKGTLHSKGDCARSSVERKKKKNGNDRAILLVVTAFFSMKRGVENDTYSARPSKRGAPFKISIYWNH